MCTAMITQTPMGDVYFGRTMDFSYLLDPQMYFVPRNYKWNNLLSTHKIHNQYAFMGIGQDISPLMFADGVNEMGFAAAVLYFPGCAQYDPIQTQESATLSVAATELVHFLLGMCPSVQEAASLLPTIRIVGIEDSVTGSVAPLHWIMADKSGKCMVIERTADGLHIMDNPIGVLSNSPDFGWHMTNLRNYMNVSPGQKQNAEWGSVKLSPFGQGAGAFGLPGDNTPPSRFVRMSYLKTNTPLSDEKSQAVTTCFHIMENVSIPKGPVITERETPDFTQYTSFMNLNAGEYYFKTYDNCRIITAGLPEKQADGQEIISFGKLIRPAEFDEWKI